MVDKKSLTFTKNGNQAFETKYVLHSNDKNFVFVRVSVFEIFLFQVVSIFCFNAHAMLGGRRLCCNCVAYLADRLTLVQN